MSELQNGRSATVERESSPVFDESDLRQPLFEDGPEDNFDDLDDLDSLKSGMPLWESMRVALRGLSNNKMRTGLTMLGIIIGVCAVIAMVSMGQGASESVSKSINSLGTNLLTVHPGNERLRSGKGGSMLTLADASAIESRFKTSIKAVAPQVRGGVTVKMGNQEVSTQLIGTTPNYAQVDNSPAQTGRFLTDGDVSGRSKVVVIGTTVVSNLMGDSTESPIGKTIAINRVPYVVVGILATKGSGAWGQDQDDVVIVPVTTALRRVFNRQYLDDINIEATTPEMMDLATQQISNLLRQRHHLLPPFPDNDDFDIRNQASLLQTSQSVTGTMTTLLAGVAVVSLIVGGIGVMNIMLVSVTERTREIGLRKAVGATSGDILIQFLIEALVMALIGGLIGIVLGIGISAFFASKMGWATVIQPGIILLAAGVSAGVGVVFGIYPAARAAGQSPISALRYE